MNIGQVLSELGVKLNITLVILTAALVLARILPVMILSPFMGGEVTPPEVRMGMGVMLTIVLFPAVSGRMAYIPITAGGFIAVLLKEIFIGVCLSFIVSMVFEAVQIAGTVIDTLSGANMAQVMVPQIQTQVTLFSSLKLQLVTAVFLTLNGHHRVIQIFGDSFVTLPLDKFPAFSNGSWAFYDLIIRVFGDLLKLGLALAAPAFFATFLTDLALGMVNRVAPQIQVYFISMSIKPIVAVLMVLLVIHLVLGSAMSEFGSMFQVLERAVRYLT